MPATLPTIEHFGADQEKQIRATFEKLFSDACAEAFRAAKLKTPLEVAKAGLVIRPAESLRKYSAEQLGITEVTRLAHVDEFFGSAFSSVQGATIPASRDGRRYTMDGRTQIYLHSGWAFNGESLLDNTFSLDDVMSHEFIHAGGRARTPSKWFTIHRVGSLRHDLAGFFAHDSILAACR